MDTLFAPDYDERWGRLDPTHRSMLGEFLSLCPPGGSILDAACGTGKYWPMILESGCSVVGADHSRQMMSSARAKFPEVPVEKVGLQDLRHEDEFDGVVCVDAMENLPPEDWPLVLRNFHRALRGTGPLYVTVETAPEGDIEAAFVAGREMGLPLVRGEWAHEGGYHFYPELAVVRQWAEEASFGCVMERPGDGYHHFLLRKET